MYTCANLWVSGLLKKRAGGRDRPEGLEGCVMEEYFSLSSMLRIMSIDVFLIPGVTEFYPRPCTWPN